jgi:sugar phosphate isomerase/epimerase
MKYGAMNFPVKPLLKEIEDIGEMGFDYVEMTMDPPEANPQKALAQKKAIRNLLNRYGMGMTCHLPTFLLAADLYESLREVSLKENSLALEAAAELGIKKAVLHPGYITGLAKFMPDRARRYGMESIELVLAKATSLGLTLCLENMFPQTQFLSNPQDFQEVFDRFPDLRLTLDIGHANLGGGRNKASEFVRRYGYRIGHVHANDNFGKEDNHLPVGAGTIDFEKILRELNQAHYDDTITLEVFSKDKDYLRLSRDKVKKMWEAL